MILIPNTDKRFIQTNRSRILGNLWSTFNTDFTSNRGVIRVSPRMKLNASTADDAQLGTPVAFKFFDAYIFAICGGSVFKSAGMPQSTFTEDASTGAQTDFSADESDMEIFNGTLCATTTDGLFSKATNSGQGDGAWTSRDALGTGGQHVMCYFKKYDRLYYTDLFSLIRSINTSWTTADPGTSYAITLGGDTDYTITSMKATSQAIWIGTFNTKDESGFGKVLKWDGLSSTISDEYHLNGGCMAIVIDPVNDIPYVMDAYGILSRFTGNGFVEVGRLPISSKRLQGINDTDAADRFIHPNGLIFTKEGTIRALVNNKNVDATYNENFQAGIYEFDLNGSCVHIASPSYTPTATTTITDFGQSRVSRVGALAQMDVYSTAETRNGTYLCGFDYFTNASSTASGIFYNDSNDTLQKYGYLVTTQILSSELTDMWRKIYARFKKFLNSTDKIVLKYRTVDVEPTEISITWVNTTSFTTTTDLSALVGYEIEVVNGTGAGQCSHIVSVTGSGTFTVTVDETYTGVTTGTAKARYQNWKKIGSYSAQTSQFAQFSIDTSDVWVQLKVCVKWTGKNEIYDLALSNATHQKL